MYKFYRVGIVVVGCVATLLSAMEDCSMRVKTTDKIMVKLPLSALESSSLLYTEYACKKAKKIDRIIVFSPVNKARLDLFTSGVIALKKSVTDFEKYYEKTTDNGLLRELINVAGELQSSNLTAYLVHCFFPNDISENIASCIKQSSIEALRYKIIKKNGDQYVNSIMPVGTDLSCVEEPMTVCSCAKLLASEKMFFNNNKSVLVEIDPLDNSAILSCKKSDRSLALLGHDFPIKSVHFSSNGATLLTCSYNDVSNQHRMILWDINDFEGQGIVREVKMIKGYDAIRRVVFSPSGEAFVVLLDNGIFRIYSAIDGSCVQYKGLYNRVGNQIKGVSCPGVFFGCENRVLIVMNFGTQSSCSIWDTFTGKKICSLHDKLRPFKAGCFLADGYIVTTCVDELVGGERFDLCGEESREMLVQLMKAIKPNILSVYALWRWSMDGEKNYLLSDDGSPLNKLMTYFQCFFV